MDSSWFGVGFSSRRIGCTGEYCSGDVCSFSDCDSPLLLILTVLWSVKALLHSCTKFRCELFLFVLISEPTWFVADDFLRRKICDRLLTSGALLFSCYCSAVPCFDSDMRFLNSSASVLTSCLVYRLIADSGKSGDR